MDSRGIIQCNTIVDATYVTSESEARGDDDYHHDDDYNGNYVETTTAMGTTLFLVKL